MYMYNISFTYNLMYIKMDKIYVWLNTEHIW